MKENTKCNVFLAILFASLIGCLFFGAGIAKAAHPANECMELLKENPTQWGEEANGYLEDIYPEYILAANDKPIELRISVSQLLVRACNEIGNLEDAVDVVVEMTSPDIFDFDVEVSP